MTGLYDIGAFLEGIGTSVEEARSVIDPMIGHEDDILLHVREGEVGSLQADDVARLLAMADRLLAIWEDDTHVLVVRSPFSGWSIEHSLRCRATGNMAGCAYHKIIAKMDERGGMPVGRNVMTLNDEGNIVHFERVPS